MKSDKKSATILLSQLAAENYPHFESKIVLVGEPGAGKTSIARYLSGQQPKRSRMSTDGKQLFTGLAYIDIETEEWLCGQQGDVINKKNKSCRKSYLKTDISYLYTYIVMSRLFFSICKF